MIKGGVLFYNVLVRVPLRQQVFAGIDFTVLTRHALNEI